MTERWCLSPGLRACSDLLDSVVTVVAGVGSGELERHTAWPAHCRVRHFVACPLCRPVSVVSSRVRHVFTCPSYRCLSDLSSRVLHNIVTCPSCRHVSFVSSRVLRVVTRSSYHVRCAALTSKTRDRRNHTGTVFFIMSVIVFLSFIHCPVLSS